MRKFIIRLTGVASLALAALPVLGLAQAAQAAEPVARVAIGDLDLSKPAQATVLEARIQTAGAQLCKTREANDNARSSIHRAACVGQVREEVLRQLQPAQRDAVRIAANAKAVSLASR